MPTPIKAIRAKCLDCMCGSANEGRLCPATDCSLYPFRFGKNPCTTRNYTDEQREAMRERLAKINSERKTTTSRRDPYRAEVSESSYTTPTA